MTRAPGSLSSQEAPQGQPAGMLASTSLKVLAAVWARAARLGLQSGGDERDAPEAGQVRTEDVSQARRDSQLRESEPDPLTH